MENKNFMTVDEVAQELNVSKSYAYKVVRELDAEMQKLGYLTVTGRVNTSFFRKKLCYRKECGRRSSNEVGIVDRVNDLGAMAWAVAPKLLCEGFNFGIVD